MSGGAAGLPLAAPGNADPRSASPPGTFHLPDGCFASAMIVGVMSGHSPRHLLHRRHEKARVGP